MTVALSLTHRTLFPFSDCFAFVLLEVSVETVLIPEIEPFFGLFRALCRQGTIARTGISMGLLALVLLARSYLRVGPGTA
jgi:hypothetical protein